MDLWPGYFLVKSFQLFKKKKNLFGRSWTVTLELKNITGGTTSKKLYNCKVSLKNETNGKVENNSTQVDRCNAEQAKYKRHVYCASKNLTNIVNLNFKIKRSGSSDKFSFTKECSRKKETYEKNYF